MKPLLLQSHRHAFYQIQCMAEMGATTIYCACRLIAMEPLCFVLTKRVGDFLLRVQAKLANVS